MSAPASRARQACCLCLCLCWPRRGRERLELKFRTPVVVLIGAGGSGAGRAAPSGRVILPDKQTNTWGFSIDSADREPADDWPQRALPLSGICLHWPRARKRRVDWRCLKCQPPKPPQTAISSLSCPLSAAEHLQTGLKTRMKQPFQWRGPAWQCSREWTNDDSGDLRPEFGAQKCPDTKSSVS